MKAFHRFFSAVALLLPAVVVLRAAQPPIAQSSDAFRSSVNLVTIQASVRDHRGRPLSGLTSNDFEVLDNGALRPILSLRADLRAPVSVAVLVDMSGSMRIGQKIAMARQAFESIARQLRNGEDEVALFTFDSALHERQPFTRDFASIEAALADLEPFGTTSLYDATAETARAVAARATTHKAVIVITDGLDTSSTLTAEEVSGLASSIDVPVYIVATVPPVDQRALVESAGDRAPRAGAADMRDLAEWTGGRLLVASTITETVIASASLVNELRQQYILAIEAADVREWRRLEVRVKQGAATVRARSGYFGG